jgi:hypothetical protein
LILLTKAERIVSTFEAAMAPPVRATMETVVYKASGAKRIFGADVENLLKRGRNLTIFEVKKNKFESTSYLLFSYTEEYQYDSQENIVYYYDSQGR